MLLLLTARVYLQQGICGRLFFAPLPPPLHPLSLTILAAAWLGVQASNGMQCVEVRIYQSSCSM